MVSGASHTPLGNPKHGGALFLLPPEVRNMIYRLLVKGHYRAHAPVDWWGYTGPDLAILRVSKAVGGEAAGALYSESVFRFIFYSELGVETFDVENLARLHRVAFKMQNIVLDFDHWSLLWIERRTIREIVSEIDAARGKSLSAAIDLFGGSKISRQSLKIRIFSCWPDLLGDTLFTTFCQRLNVFTGFRTSVVELFPIGKKYCRGLDEVQTAQDMSDLVSQLGAEVREQLEPAFGPATSEFKSDAGSVPLPYDTLLSLGGIGLVDFIDFHPAEHLAKKIRWGER